ncbi:4-hydroxy-tetrahydrodipicolinate synthase [Frankia sp. CcI49]|uniref:4-hydroxy-tetrahydrodipicolinate synthase n=1 Tax=Frankia sp. CcI49 TaxID=1745382 RepID=UPI00097638BB|nr:4-hydroxy-tetrahydrodipicolinate synthase [Frankia sp. CcI49]ONH60274.1 4-hydroxy-tetrahydrodipicolinate synthase [Frankia sp. CcI49]
MSEVPASVAGMSALPPAPFGRMITAMITPFTSDGGLDVPGAAALAEHLVDAGNEALVINGTTGESPTTSDAEKDTLLRVVREAVGGRAQIIAGVGTNDTRHTLELAGAAEKAGADGLLVVTPYYSKPPQAGLLAHFRAVADATGLPTMIYDIPGRSGVPVATETLLRLAEHPRIVAVKDAKDDLAGSSWVLANTGLAYYSGTDVLNLPLLSVGACGVVSVVGHVAAPAIRAMIEAFGAGEVGRAIALHKGLLPAYEGIFRTQGVITAKAALAMAGLPAGPVRSPLVDATEAERARLRADLAAAVLDPAAAAARGGAAGAAGSAGGAASASPRSDTAAAAAGAAVS